MSAAPTDIPPARIASAAGTTRRSKPARPASATRRSLWLQERSSPVRLISPIAATLGGSGTLRSAEAMARATARSAAGSSMRIPPAIVTKMSLVDNGSRPWRPSTATSMARRLRSSPTATRRGMASSVRLTRAWTSTAKAAAALDGDVHRRPDSRPRVAEKQRRRIGDALQAGGGHLEDPQFVRGAEAVLGGAQGAIEAVAVALELQHSVDHVLEHARAGDRALLGDVADEEDGRAGGLGQAEEAARRFAHLADAARRRGEGVAVQGLHGVDHDQRRRKPRRRSRGPTPARSRRGQRCRRGRRRCARRAS